MQGAEMKGNRITGFHLPAQNVMICSGYIHIRYRLSVVIFIEISAIKALRLKNSAPFMRAFDIFDGAGARHIIQRHPKADALRALT